MQHAYLELKISWELFQKAPESLSEPERQRVREVAGRQQGIEQRILASDQAARVIVPHATLDNRLQEIRQRYASEEEMRQDIERQGLCMETLEAAVERDLKVESVLERVASSCHKVSAVEAEIYYRLHPEAFDRPEARKLRHILVTFDSPTDREKAKATLEAVRTATHTVHQFGEAALSHSQCPTAMEGGKLGTVKRNQLFPALEPAAFALLEGGISEVLESPIGLHLIYCEEILPFGMLPFDAVKTQIIERLTDKRRREAQRDWIKGLFAKPVAA